MAAMANAIFFIGGVITGAIITYLIIVNLSSGDLRVDHSDDQPYLFLELKDDIHDILNKKFVVLKVVVKDFLPRE